MHLHKIIKGGFMMKNCSETMWKVLIALTLLMGVCFGIHCGVDIARLEPFCLRIWAQVFIIFMCVIFSIPTSIMLIILEVVCWDFVVWVMKGIKKMRREWK